MKRRHEISCESNKQIKTLDGSSSSKFSTSLVEEVPTLLPLMNALEEQFPIQEVEFYKFFPFTNEIDYLEVMRKLSSIPRNFNRKHKAVLLVGNSNLPSILPELLQADLILLADVDARLHEHNAYLLDCLRQSKSIQEFLIYYEFLDNPAQDVQFENGSDAEIFNYEWLKDSMEKNSESLGEYGFLSSPERFQKCRDAAMKLPIVHIHLDLTHSKACHNLAVLLEEHNTEFMLCNLSNIHWYDNQKLLSYSLRELLHTSHNYFLMYSQEVTMDSNVLKIHLVQGLNKYFQNCIQKAYQDPQAAPSFLFQGNSSHGFFAHPPSTTAVLRSSKEEHTNPYLILGTSNPLPVNGQ